MGTLFSVNVVFTSPLEGGGSGYTGGGPSCHPHRRTEWQKQVQTPGGGRQPEKCHGNARRERKQDHFKQYI